MRYSQLFIPTLKETPADATVASHQLLVRAGFIRQLSAGVYSYLPLGQRAIQKATRIVREEMDAIGGQEFLLPALSPRELWEESGRWTVMGDNMFRLKDRKGADYCLAMTHEEVFTAIARGELRSYKQLPQTWYQIQTKFRDEARPKSGLLRVRQFTMKDSYSFDADQAGLDVAFEKHRAAYMRTFTRCGLSFVMVDAHSGAMGGSASTEFMVRTDAGEDLVAACPKCGYAANTEKAASRLPQIASRESGGAPEKFATPGVVTIEALAAAPYSVEAARQLKTLVYVADGKTVLAIVRGDHQLNEAKLQSATGAAEVRPAHVEEIQKALGAKPGSLGGVAVTLKKPHAGPEGFALSTSPSVFVDQTLKGARDMVTGANEDGFHLRHVDVERDIMCNEHEQTIVNVTSVDLRTVVAGEACPNCDGTLDVYKALEVGHIFKLGTKYSASMGANVLREDGASTPIVMGSYGIGVERIVAAAIELHHDADGIVWPMSIAPYHVALLPLQMQDADVRAAAEKLAAELAAAGVEVLLDDRDERPGVKFKDADLIGIPLRLAIGKKGLAEGKAEWKLRSKPGKDAVELVPLGEVAARAKALVLSEGGRLA